MYAKWTLIALLSSAIASPAWAQYVDGLVATEIGSEMAGTGSMARGIGTYNYYTARAIRELQEARALAIDNHQQAVQNWYANKEKNRIYRAMKEQRLSPGQISRISQSNRPERLTTAQYDPASGEIQWPAALLTPAFDGHRAAVDRAFASRDGQDQGADSMFQFRVRRTADRMIERLQDNIDDFSPNEYLAARSFLRSLKYEALSAGNPEALARRDRVTNPRVDRALAAR